MTNSTCIARKFSKRSPNTITHQVHHHIRLDSGRVEMAQVYPDKVCRAICEGFKKQLEQDSKGQFLIVDYAIDESRTSRELLNMSKR